MKKTKSRGAVAKKPNMSSVRTGSPTIKIFRTSLPSGLKVKVTQSESSDGIGQLTEELK